MNLPHSCRLNSSLRYTHQNANTDTPQISGIFTYQYENTYKEVKVHIKTQIQIQMKIEMKSTILL